MREQGQWAAGATATVAPRCVEPKGCDQLHTTAHTMAQFTKAKRPGRTGLVLALVLAATVAGPVMLYRYGGDRGSEGAAQSEEKEVGVSTWRSWPAVGASSPGSTDGLSAGRRWALLRGVGGCAEKRRPHCPQALLALRQLAAELRDLAKALPSQRVLGVGRGTGGGGDGGRGLLEQWEELKVQVG